MRRSRPVISAAGSMSSRARSVGATSRNDPPVRSVPAPFACPAITISGTWFIVCAVCGHCRSASHKGYHSNQILVDLEAVGVRAYLSEPDRGRRNWRGKTTARDAVYRNRRRLRGARGQRLLRQRGERLERPFAHLYETGALRRVHLRGHTNILKRVLVHTGGFNLGLLMRRLIGVGTPRGLQGRLTAVFDTLCTLLAAVDRASAPLDA